MVLLTRSLSLETAVAAARAVLEPADLTTLVSPHTREYIRSLTSSTFGRCVLGIAGFLEFADAQMRAFVREAEPSDERVHDMSELLLLLAAAVADDEDNATFIARIGSHMLLVQLMEHEHESIQEAAAMVVSSCTSTVTGISFPHRARPLGTIERPAPLSVPLPLDPRDAIVVSSSNKTDAATKTNNDVLSVLIRQVTTRMTGQPKTGYLLWGAAFVLARWVHAHRELFYNKRVLEVGSGLGLGGITAARYARSTVLTDYQDDTCRALAYNVALNEHFTHALDARKPPVVVEHLDWDDVASIGADRKVDVVIACDIICEPSTAEGFLRVVRHRLEANGGVAYLMNADSHSRFGVLHLHALLAASDFVYSITPVLELADGALLLETVADAQELAYEFYEIRLPPTAGVAMETTS